MQRLLSPEWQRRLQYRWRRWNEWRLRPVFFRRQKQCIHYLYPENSLFHGPSWKRHHGLVLSCHQPGTVLKKFVTQSMGDPLLAALRQADRVVVLTSHFLDAYREFCCPDSLRVIPHGVDTEFFHPSEQEEARPLVLTIGNWLRDYNFWGDVALQLAKDIPEVEFVVIAMPQVVAEARSRVEALLGNRARFLNGVSDVQLKALYQQAAVLFLPLQDAGANNALLEAMASGLPVLVTDLPATREYGGDAVSYFSLGEYEGCLSQLREFVSGRQARREHAVASRKRAVEHFGWEVIAARYARLYAEVLEAGQPQAGAAEGRA